MGWEWDALERRDCLISGCGQILENDGKLLPVLSIFLTALLKMAKLK